MRHFLVATVILIHGGLSGLCAREAGRGGASNSTYENHAYGYSVKLPAEVAYRGTVPPNPDHGLAIDLQSGGLIWVDASYTESLSLAEEVASVASGCRIEHRSIGQLGKLPAVVLTLSCPSSPYAKACKELIVLAVYRRKGVSLIDYQVGLRVPNTIDFKRYMHLFNYIRTGFEIK